MASLEPILGPDLDAVFAGTEPGPHSLRVGHYYANPNNSFYRALNKPHQGRERPKVLPNHVVGP